MKNNDKNYSVIILTYAPKDSLLISLEKLISQSIVPKNIIIYNTDKNLLYSNIKNRDRFENFLSSNSDLIKIVNIEYLEKIEIIVETLEDLSESIQTNYNEKNFEILNYETIREKFVEI